MDAHTLALFLKAALIGLSIAAPVGPIGLLCIQRTLEHGQRVGLATGLGAAVADAAYGAVGAFGVTWLIRWLTEARIALGVVGGAFLLWLAWRTWQAPAATRAAVVAGSAGQPGLWHSFAGTFFLTLSNPATILSFVAIFAALSSQGPVAAPGWMVLGVLCGSALWWLGLSSGVAAMRHRIAPSVMQAINRGSALALGAFGLYQLARVFAG